MVVPIYVNYSKFERLCEFECNVLCTAGFNDSIFADLCCEFLREQDSYFSHGVFGRRATGFAPPGGTT